MAENCEKYAYVTVVTNERYLDGCCVLYESLRKVGIKYPFYVLIPTNSNPEMIQRLKLRQINCLFADDQYCQNIGNIENKRQYWGETVFKLEIYRLVQFDKIVFLDADMFVLKNIDHLFLKPHMSAVIAGKSLHPNWVGLNSGLMVIKPDLTEFVGLQTCIDAVVRAQAAAGQGFGDQNVIKAYFRNWPAISSLHLDETYNVMLGYAGAMKRAKLIESVENISVYHFTGEQKPWSNHLLDRIAVIAKIIKRKGCLIDFQVLYRYKKCLLMVRRQ